MNITSIQSVVPLLDCMDHNTGAYANLHVSENVGAYSHQDKVWTLLLNYLWWVPTFTATPMYQLNVRNEELVNRFYTTVNYTA